MYEYNSYPFDPPPLACLADKITQTDRNDHLRMQAPSNYVVENLPTWLSTLGEQVPCEMVAVTGKYKCCYPCLILQQQVSSLTNSPQACV